MKYYIGDVARMLGVTVGALRFFEKEKVITAPKEENGRRYYEKGDILRVISYKKYRSMGLKLREIAEQFSKSSNGITEIKDQLLMHLVPAEEKFNSYQRSLKELKWYISSIENFEKYKDTCDICMSPEMIGISFEGDGFASRDRNEQQQISEWLQYMPQTKITMFNNGEEAKMGYCMLNVGNTEEILNKYPKSRLIPSQLCLHTFVSVQAKLATENPKLLFEPIIGVLKINNMQVDGDIIAVIIAIDGKTKNRNVYAELWAPLKFELVK